MFDKFYATAEFCTMNQINIKELDVERQVYKILTLPAIYLLKVVCICSTADVTLRNLFPVTCQVNVTDFLPSVRLLTSTAHPLQDTDGTWWNIGCGFSIGSKYIIYKLVPTASNSCRGKETHGETLICNIFFSNCIIIDIYQRRCAVLISGLCIQAIGMIAAHDWAQNLQPSHCSQQVTSVADVTKFCIYT